MLQKKRITTPKLVYTAMLSALYAVLNYLSPEAAVLRLSAFCFLPVAVGGMLMGPFYGAAIAGLGDLIACLLKGYLPDPRLSLIALATGAWYGWVLHGRTFSWKLVLCSVLPIFVVLEMGLSTWVLSDLFHQPFAAVFMERLWSNLIELPIKAALLMLINRVPKSILKL